MTLEVFEAALQAHLDQKPFQVFVIELKTGQRYEVDHPRALAYSQGLVSMIAPGRIPAWFDHDSVVQIITAPSSMHPANRDPEG